jgi:antitoxin component YwqK of YwqJK toxin-antitoxin module
MPKYGNKIIYLFSVKHSYFLLFVFSHLIGFSQNTCVELSSMNLVYKGIENPIKIVVKGVPSKSTVIRTTDGITYTGSNLIAHSKSEPFEYIYLGRQTGQDTIWLDTVEMRVRSLPKPTARLGGLPNDGLPKGKAAVLAQSSVLATMGAGFAYPLKYQIVGYKLIVAYADKPPVMYSGNGSQLTGQIRKAMAEMSGGDKILIEGIKAKESKYGFKAELSPIIITIRSEHPTYFKNENSFTYARVKDEDHNQEYYLNSTYDIAQLADTFQNGLIDIFSQGANGHFRTSSYYMDGNEYSRAIYDDYNRLLSTQKRIDSIHWRYTSYYWNEQKKVETQCAENQVLQGTEEFASCYDRKRISESSNLDISNGCQYDSILMDLFSLFLESDIASTGNFKSYYENGQLKTEGILVMKEGAELPKGVYCGTGITYYDYTNSTVLDGKWKFYSASGKLLETRKYDKGKRIK